MAVVLTTALVGGWIAVSMAAEQSPRMSKEVLRNQLGSAVVIVIDLRIEPHWRESDLKIKGAIRENPAAVDAWANKYAKDKTIVLYCA